MLTTLYPAARIASAAVDSRARLDASLYFGLSDGNNLPMSPRPAAPSSASITACVSTSASEWPSSPVGWPMETPPRMRSRPALKRWTSYPMPTFIQLVLPLPGGGWGGGGFLLFDQSLHDPEILGCRELDVGRLAFDHRHRVTGRGHQLGVVVADQSGVSSLPMRTGEQLIREGLRRLGQDDARPVQALDQPIAFDSLDRIPRGA